MDLYKLVLASVLETQNLPLFHVLKGTPIEGRETVLEEMFKEAARQRNDEAALQIFGWLMQAMSDRELFPILEPERFKYHYKLPSGGPYVPGVEKILQTAAMLMAAKACLLYEYLPEFQTDTIRRLVNEEEYQKGDDRHPTLLKTRGCILKEIAKRCFKTPDNEESRTLLDFLLDIKFKFTEERDLYLKTIQDATDDSVELPRIEKHYIHTMNRGRIDKKNRFVNADTAHLLGKAWVRKLGNMKWDLNDRSGDTRSGLEKLLAAIEIMEPLSRVSSGAIVYLKEIAYRIALTDEEIAELVRMMKEEFRGGFVPNHISMTSVWGHITVDYKGSLENIVVKVDVSRKEVGTEDKMQDLFHLAETRIRNWREKGERRTRFEVELKVLVHNPDAPQDKKEDGDDVLFKREGYI